MQLLGQALGIPMARFISLLLYTSLNDAGAVAAWNMYSQAGVGLASEVISYYKDKR